MSYKRGRRFDTCRPHRPPLTSGLPYLAPPFAPASPLILRCASTRSVTSSFCASSAATVKPPLGGNVLSSKVTDTRSRLCDAYS